MFSAVMFLTSTFLTETVFVESQPADNKTIRVAQEMKIRILIPLVILGVFVSGFVLIPDYCLADTESSIIAEIKNEFYNKSLDYGDKLKGFALGIFRLFLLVDIAIFGVKAALNRSDLGEIISGFIMMLLWAGFCFCAITYYQDWTQYLLDKSFNISTTVILTPVDTGFQLVKNVLDLMHEAEWKEILAYVIVLCIILICFALMTARMLIVLCESYIAMNVAILMLGFGGAGITKDYAINAMRFALSVAFKLLTMQLIMAVGLSFINDLKVVEHMALQDLFVFIACTVILLALIQSLPETVAGIINGSHVGSGVGLKAALGASVGAMAGAAMGGAGKAAGAAQTATRGAQMLSAAHKIASLEGHQDVKKSVNSMLGAGGQTTGNSFKDSMEHLKRMGGAIYSANQQARHSMNKHSTQARRTKANLQSKAKEAADAKEMMKQ